MGLLHRQTLQRLRAGFRGLSHDRPLRESAPPSHPPFFCGLSRHSRENEPFLFTLPVSASFIKSVPTMPSEKRSAVSCFWWVHGLWNCGRPTCCSLALSPWSPELLGLCLDPTPRSGTRIPGAAPAPGPACSPVSFSAHRTWRHKVHLLRGAAVAQRLLQLQEVLPVAGGPRLPHREGRHPVPRLREGHLRAAACVTQAHVPVSPHGEGGGQRGARLLQPHLAFLLCFSVIVTSHACVTPPPFF